MFPSQSEPGPVTGRLIAGRDPEAVVTGALLIAVAVVAWVWTIYRGASMTAMSMAPASSGTSGMGMSGTGMSGMGMAATGNSAPTWLIAAGAYLLAWGVMMAAMMLPSATPMITMYAVGRRRWSQTGQRAIPTALFALVYLAVWLAAGIPVYLVGLLIGQALASFPAAAGAVPVATGLILIAAGAFQFSPLKRACLRVCQHPFAFLLGHWHSGYGGTLRMAWEHATFCVGCCWALMLVLVAAGAMSLPWMLLIAVVVTAEKLVPARGWTERVVGVVLVALGAVVVAQPALATAIRAGGM